MADQNVTNGVGSVPVAGLGKRFVLSNEIDLSAIDGLATTDVIQALNIEAGTFVENVFVRIVEPTVNGTGNTTVTVGDATNADGFDTSVNLEADANTVTCAGFVLTEGTPNTLADAYAGGKVYTADDTLDLVLTITGAVTAWGKIEVIAACTKLY